LAAIALAEVGLALATRIATSRAACHAGSLHTPKGLHHSSTFLGSFMNWPCALSLFASLTGFVALP